MFHKLRLKLALINATIIVFLFLLLIAGTYYYSHGKILQLSDELSERIMDDIKKGLITDLPNPHNVFTKEDRPYSSERGTPLDKHSLAPRPPHEFVVEQDKNKRVPPPPMLIAKPPGPNFFFIKLSPDGTILSQSSNQPLTNEKRDELLKFVLKNNMSKGEIMLDENEYRYLKDSMNTTPDTILLFQDFTRENHMLHIQLTALTVTGLICLILSIFGSVLMAKRAMVPIQHAWQQQKDFLSDASHELRTPLTVIQTNLDIVLDSQEETVGSQLKWLYNIQEESAKMASLVDSLLFLARSDANQQLLQHVMFSLTEALLESAATFEPLANVKNLPIDLAASTDIKIHGDKQRMKQVISILLDNAIRHTSSGKISLTLSQAVNKIVLTVADSGEGIAPESLNKVFDRFYQADKARSKGGAGLGLAIAKCIIEKHNGTISVASTLGFGTTFTIELPVKK